MSDEAALLAGIAADPTAALPRLVYADWLDDHGDPRGELVRLEQHLVAHPDDDAALVRFRDLAAGCDPDWLALFIRPQVARCGLLFASPCTRRWGDLTATADPTVRECDDCAKPVYLSTSRVDAYRRSRAGECVAVDVRLVDPIQLPPGARPRLVFAGDSSLVDCEMTMLGRPVRPAPPAGLWARFRRRLLGR